MKSGYVAILGQPNVGKSTLLNRIVGEPVAIVSPRPQTTRQRIVGVLHRTEGEIVIVDTPGYHSIPRPMHHFMLNEIEKTIQDCNLFCFLLDPKTDEPDLDDQLMDRLKGHQPIVVVNKADLLSVAEREKLANQLQKRWGLKELYFISAIHGDGIEELIRYFFSQLPEGAPHFEEDVFTQMPMRFLAGEAVREQAFLLLHQELPYGLTAHVLTFEEKPQITVITAQIIVERETHKGMVIGKGGAMIKKIGTRAREKIEYLMGGKVFLELEVKVDADWTMREEKLREYGYV